MAKLDIDLDFDFGFTTSSEEEIKAVPEASSGNP